MCCCLLGHVAQGFTGFTGFTMSGEFLRFWVVRSPGVEGLAEFGRFYKGTIRVLYG